MPETQSATEPGALLASYVDRIVEGGNLPANAQVQAPTKDGLAINFKAAKGLGLEVPPTLLDCADDRIVVCPAAIVHSRFWPL
jgi:hypothetical protein